LRGQLLEILHGAYSLFSWNREMGVDYLDISDESIRTVRGWVYKSSERADNNPDRKITPEKHDTRQPSSEIKRAQVRRPEIRVADNNNRPEAPQKFSRRALPNAEVPPQVDGATESADEFICCKGDLNSQLFFFSEALDYSTPAGELFLKILKAINLDRERIALATFDPLDYTQGLPKIRQKVTQLSEQAEELINGARIRTKGRYPQVICTFGDAALKIFMGSRYLLTDARGIFHNYNGIELMPTYHPAQILKDQALKRLVWEDMKQIMAKQGFQKK